MLLEDPVLLGGVYLRPAADCGATKAMNFANREVEPLFCLHLCSEPDLVVRFRSRGLIRFASSREISCQSRVPQDCTVLAQASFRDVHLHISTTDVFRSSSDLSF